MADVIMLQGTQANYDALATKNASALYFLTDTKKIMKGTDDYTTSVIVGSALPESGQLQGRLYIVGTTGSVWTGSAWKTVFETPDIQSIVNTHAAVLAGAAAGHVKSGADVEVANGLITVKKIGGTDWATIKSALDSAIDAKAPKANPTFTGTVTVPTPTADGAAATKGYVDSKIAANDAMRFKGTIGTGGDVTALPASYRVGDTYRVITAGTYAGVACEIGDLLIAMVTKTSGGTNADWTVAQTNIDGAVVGAASSTNDTLVLFDGATGKKIKGSSITVTQINTAIANSHTHANRAKLDTYDKTQTELLAAAQTTAQGLVNAKTYNIADLLDVDVTGVSGGQLLGYDAASSSWKPVSQINISGKLDKVTAGKADEIITANADGTVKTSGKKIGGATLAASPNVNTIATEAAVRAAADNAKIQWQSI